MSITLPGSASSNCCCSVLSNDASLWLCAGFSWWPQADNSSTAINEQILRMTNVLPVRHTGAYECTVPQPMQRGEGKRDGRGGQSGQPAARAMLQAASRLSLMLEENLKLACRDIATVAC